MRSLLRIFAAIALTMAGALVVASPASADQVWHQAFERASAEAPCPAPTTETAWQDSYTGQQEWTPSWAEWANGGKGGWVCQRYIVWAKDGAAGPGCVQASPAEWLDFLGASSLPIGAPDYVDPSCTTTDLTIAFNVVYAPAGQAQADALCQAIFGFPTAGVNFGFPVYGCAVIT